MGEMKIIENDLVPVYETDKGIKVVYGTELHSALEVKSNYREWANRRFSDIDAIKDEDFQAVEFSTPSGQAKKEHIINLDTAKEMAMLERNNKGKKIRKYFIDVEKKHKQGSLDLEQLNPTTRLMNLLVQSISQNELEQKRLSDEQKKQGEQIKKIEETQTTIAETFKSTSDIDNFQRWVSNCISKIAESPKFTDEATRSTKYSMARSESYKRLTKKRNCRLDDRVQRAKGRALEERPDIKKAELNKINKLYVIANDKDLRPAYELVIKEMMMCYCVGTK